MQKEGVGEMTPSIIKLPFWEMTYKNEKVFYACLNQKKSSAPEHIKDKLICPNTWKNTVFQNW